jgi:CBS domain-containing protein
MPVKITSVMTQRVITVSPDEPVAQVAGTLARHGISGAPVCDQDGKLLGMISEGDLMHPFAQDNRLFRSWWLSLIAEGAKMVPPFVAYIHSDARCARDLMTCPAITADEGMTLGEIVDLLQRHHIKRIPILRGDTLIGVVSRADILSALHRMPDAFGGRIETHAPIGSTDPCSASLGSLTKQRRVGPDRAGVTSGSLRRAGPE